MSHHNLLVELFVEELPPKALKKLGESFGNELLRGLEEHDFLEADSKLTIFATPRRLAARITNVMAVSREKVRKVKLMPVAVGLDANGLPTQSLIKKLIGTCGYHDEVNFESIIKERVTKEIEDSKEILYHTDIAAETHLAIRLEFAILDAIENLPIPKVMTYQLEDGWTSVNFVRPAHGLVVLHGETPLKNIRVLGLESNNVTHGHRFEGSPSPIEITSADSYEEQLKTEGAVIASFDARKAEIVRQLNAAAAKENLKPIDDDALLDEVTALVERPNVLLGQFEEIYLEVPQECLILTMKANQKYFPLLDASGKLTNKFLIISNINPADPSAVIGGNERVVRPRLADAKFFFDQDRKKTLESRVEGLGKVVYHNKLGSQGERNARVVKIAGEIAKKIGDANLVAKVELAARLSKTDLVTDMVGEFPELQGIMGRYYAQNEGLEDDVAFAIEDHYKPRFAGDELPRNQVGVCVALADKLETLVGMFGIGNLPTGDKDPFALRRHALGATRLLTESSLALNLSDLLSIAQTVTKEWNRYSILHANDHLMLQAINSDDDWFIAVANSPSSAPWEDMLPSDAAISQLSTFIYERISGYLRDQGASSQEADAVLSLAPDLLSKIPKQLEAVRSFATLPEAPALAAANKRVGNILKKVEGEVKAEVSEKLLQEPAEIALNKALIAVKPKADAAFEAGDYTSSLQALAALKAPVDDFFDNVMVNAEDVDLKNNRLALLNQLHQAMNRVADLSKLAS